ncbi:mucin-2 [Streptomyces hygroscopicus]|uniref:mucin-2 n=1 Tax=Streptomyces hygroscopicus TaxID=1912 RepID=UPI0033F8F181
MPHFAVDESAHAHRKVMRAGNAAFGLWVRFGSYACDHLTDGMIPAEIAAMYGTAPQLAKLTKLGMLHGAGHNCPRCAQPEEGDYVIHDYLGPNASRAEVQRRREKAAEKKRGQRAAAESKKNRTGNEDDSSANRGGNADENASNRPPVSGKSAGHEDASPGDSFQTRARPRPSPSPPLPTEEEQASCDGPDGQLPRIGDRPRIPDTCRPLVDALQAARLHVGWDLKPTEWFVIETLIHRCGIPALVTSARGSWQGARNQPRSGSYFLPAWRALPDAPAAPATAHDAGLPAAVGGDVVPFQPAQPLTGTDAKVAGWLALANDFTQEDQ